jgi:chaperone required for assembly of F1-ATPase
MRAVNTGIKRFFQHAEARSDADGYAVLLDERQLRTPKGAPFRVPTLALAEAIALEWEGQGEHIAPSSMQLTQLAFASIDWTAPSRPERVSFIASFAETDLCCHRADAPADLVQRQSEVWDPLVAWASETLGVVLPVIVGVIAAPPRAEALETVRAHAEALDDFRLTALTQATGLAGSALIGFALLRGFVDAQGAFAATALDEIWGLQRWGEDAEARARLEIMRAEFDALARFVATLNA